MDSTKSLVDRVSLKIQSDTLFSPAALHAMNLADLFKDIEPEEFLVPSSDKFGSFRHVETNKMLIKHT